MRSQPPWSDDLLQRSLIERAPPLTWRGIAGWALASVAGVILALAKVGGLGELIAVAMFIVGGMQVARGVIRMGWLKLGGIDQPVRTYLRRRSGG